MKLWAAVVLFGAACCQTGAMAAAGTSSLPETGSLLLVERMLEFEDGSRVPAQEGLLLVPENRANPASRRIPVHFWRVKAASPDRPPLFVFPGGPGDTFLPGRSGYPGYNDYGALESRWGRSMLDLAGPRSDLIFINQRGNLNVPLSTALAFWTPALPTDRLTSDERHSELLRGTVSTAQAGARSLGVDLAGYDILNYADDVDDIRKALGYERIILVGGSFGSQTSFAVAKRHPSRIDRMLVDGIEPLARTYEDPSGVNAAFARFLALADTAPALARVVPEGGFQAAYARIMTSLKARPRLVRVKHSDGTTEGVLIDHRDFARTLRTSDEGPGTVREQLATIPALILAAERGDFSRIAEDTIAARKPAAIPLIHLLLDLSLGISPERDAEYAAEARDGLMGDANLVNLSYRAVRDIIGTRTVPESFRSFSDIDVPVLMIQGDIDVLTPLENAQEQFPWLRNGTMLQVAGGTHNVLNEVMLDIRACLPMIRAFLDGAEIPKGLVHVALPPIAFSAAAHGQRPAAAHPQAREVAGAPARPAGCR